MNIKQKAEEWEQWHGSWLEEYDPQDDKYLIDDEYLETMKKDIEDTLIEQVRKERII